MTLNLGTYIIYYYYMLLKTSALSNETGIGHVLEYPIIIFIFFVFVIKSQIDLIGRMHRVRGRFAMKCNPLPRCFKH